jgi:glycogen phosphorylase
VKVETNGGQHAFEVQVYLDDVDPNAARVELYADAVNGDGPVRQVMKRGRELVGVGNGYAYTAMVPATRPPSDYTPRAIPYHPGVAVPLEEPRISWQR